MGTLWNEPDDEVDYTKSDNELFRRLADFPNSGPLVAETQAPPAGTRPFAEPDEACLYADSDTLVFDELIRVVDQIRAIRGVGRSAARPEPIMYSSDDNRHFADLMAREQLHNASGATSHETAGASAQRPETVRYTERDLSGFDKFAPDGGANASEAKRSPSVPKPNSYRDVGAIRIVDADAERAKAGRGARSKTTTLKINFFD